MPKTLLLAVLFFLLPFFASASILSVQQGGTGWGAPGGIKSGNVLYGNGINPIATSSGLTFDGTNLTVTNASNSGTVYGRTSIQNFYTGQNELIGGSNTLSLQTFNSGWKTRAEILNDGVLDVGTTTPDNAQVTIDGSSQSSILNLASFGTPVATIGGSVLGKSSNNLNISAVLNLNMGAGNTIVPDLTISTTGNVGISSSSPGTLFSVQGNDEISGNETVANLTATGTLTMTAQGTGCATFTSGVLSSTGTACSSLSTPVSIANGGTATSTMVNNSVLFYNGSNVEADNTLGWDGTNFRVGTNANNRWSANTLDINSGNGSVFVKLLEDTASNADMILSGGKVGVGPSGANNVPATSSPFALLSVAGSAGGTTPLLALSSSTSAFATSTGFEIDNNQNLLADMNGNTLQLGATVSTTSAQALTLSSNVSGSGIALYNTADQSTNYERATAAWSGNQFSLKTQAGGTGTLRDIQLVGHGNIIARGANTAGEINLTDTSATTPVVHVLINGSSGASSGSDVYLSVAPTYTETNTGGYTTLRLQPTETTLGSGASYLIQAGTSTNANLFDVTNVGHLMGSSTSPTVSSCGTTPILLGDDRHGIVTVGSGSVTGCTITFATAYTIAPVCIVSNEGAVTASAFDYTVTNTAITLAQTNLQGDVINYMCQGLTGQ